ncbi:hypothetical protein, partial [Streptomyces sp. SAS_276]|uniref:hypothetical protein n=1 Tax=Streptomyces sp. SAS_276 TaxID=3412745 RepID=UPI00403CC011
SPPPRCRDLRHRILTADGAGVRWAMPITLLSPPLLVNARTPSSSSPSGGGSGRRGQILG